MNTAGHRATRVEVFSIVITAALAWLLFSSTLAFVPVRWFVTLVHEAGHAALAELVGGDVRSVTINSRGGGLMMWAAPSGVSTVRLVLVASAGYVGAAIVGGIMVELGTGLRSGRFAALVLAALITAVAVAWVPWRTNPTGIMAEATGSTSKDGRFTTFFSVAAVIVFVALALQPLVRLRRALVLGLATVLCLASIDDLRALLDLASRGGHSDAVIAAAVTPLSPWLWSALWLVVGVAACSLGLWAALSRHVRPVEDSMRERHDGGK